jgi:hypothetical protein
MQEQTQDYNNLIPPENPDYPWNPTFWQPLCYYCAQPIRLVQPGAMHRQRVCAAWEHVNPVFITDIDVEKHPEIPHLKICQKYMNQSHWHCNPLKVRPTEEIDDPRCTCGAQAAGDHNGCCSAAGKPPFHATTMSQKEDELIRIFGWTSETAAKEKERVSLTEGIGVLTLAGVVLGLLAWATKSLPQRRMDVK